MHGAEGFVVNTLLALGTLILVGLLGGKAAAAARFPAVTGYLIFGLIIGPSLLGILGDGMVQSLGLVSTVALAFIAFSIGSEFEVRHLKELGGRVGWITLAEASGAFLLVSAVTYFIFHQPLYVALILGSIASATAPAATVLIIREYRAKGPLTDTLIAVVALDDAIGITFYGISVALARLLTGRVAGGANAWSLVAAPVWEIVGSFLVGLVGTIALGTIAARIRRPEDRLALVLGVVLATSGMAQLLHTSLLLTNMALGMFTVNLVPTSRRLFGALAGIDQPIYIAFFVLAGAGLHLRLLTQVGLLGIGYIVARGIGKILGAGLGARWTGAAPQVQRYLGLALIPQAGVAIGLTLLAAQAFPEIAPMLTTLILGAVVVHEMIGPFTAKIAIVGAGEVGKAAVSPSSPAPELPE